MEFLAERGLHTAVIADMTGLTKSQVSYRIHAAGLSLRAYRDGMTGVAKAYIAATPCVQMHVRARRGQVYHVREFLSESQQKAIDGSKK